jgi:hypothetical protein
MGGAVSIWPPAKFRWVWFIGFLSVGSLTTWATVIQNWPAAKPDVKLRLIRPDNPALRMLNDSDGIARGIVWQPAFFNADNPDVMKSFLERAGGEFKFLRPHRESGPFQLIDQFHLPAGTRVIGSIGVSCPTCTKARSYWVWIEVGKGGWYYENPEDTGGGPQVPPNVNQLPELVAALQTIPEKDRIPIRGDW